MRRIWVVWILLICLNCLKVSAMLQSQEEQIHLDGKKEMIVNPLSLIEEHVGDSYFWPLLGIHEKALMLPLPVILYQPELGWACFLSKRLEEGKIYKGYYIASTGQFAGKIVMKNSQGQEIRPIDLSFTKDAAALFVAGFLLILILTLLLFRYKRNPLKMPTRFWGALEMLTTMLIDEVIKPCLGRYTPKYTPYLLTLFFFILTINLLGLIVVFPGGVNLSGNISICLVLASCTLILTLLAGTRSYWKEVFWPDVPVWLNTPIPLLTIIEIFGIFSKPLALTIRMFANLLGGHIIMIVLVSLIFIFAPLGSVIAGSSAVFVILFSVFMLLVEVLVCFIQAYVFFMLSTLFIGLTKVEH